MNVKVNFTNEIGKIKPQHCVNNGPLVGISAQKRSNFDTYKAARIPYARTHDASEWIDYGGEFVVDIHSIFRDFDANPYDPSSYAFAVTDLYVQRIQEAGTETFYRLGERIEHQVMKHRTIVPKDFKKWSIICEHIIRHYNLGWANGFHYNIKYWEIWNEPDLDKENVPSHLRKCWSGTDAQFYEFYETAAVHLKKCFPDLMIGGPAIAHNTGEWLDKFLAHMTENGKKVPIDFFSWHWYGSNPKKIVDRAKIVREKLDKAGYADAESHLNEWNYVKSWGDEWINCILTMISLKGSAFNVACMCEGQKAGIDMMMYYDASPCAMNGLWDFYTWYPIKGYYSIYAFADIYELGTEVRTESDDNDIYVVGAKDENGKKAVIISYYTDENDREEKIVNVNMEGYDGEVTDIYTVDADHDYTVTDTQTSNTVTITMKPNTFVVLKNR